MGAARDLLHAHIYYVKFFWQIGQDFFTGTVLCMCS